MREARIFLRKWLGHALQAQPGADGKPHRLARVQGGTPALENVATWHERDISHLERMIGPDATVTLDRLARLTGVIESQLSIPRTCAPIWTAWAV